MHRKNLCKAVEEGTHNAIELGSAALADAAERLTPLVEQAGDVVGPWAEEARRVSADVANDAYERHKPVLRDAQIRGARLASDIATAMLGRGVYVTGFSFPVVPLGRARIRVQLSAAHSEQDIRDCVAAFIDSREEVSAD